jgi:hypothetical protein
MLRSFNNLSGVALLRGFEPLTSAEQAPTRGAGAGAASNG